MKGIPLREMRAGTLRKPKAFAVAEFAGCPVRGMGERVKAALA